MDGPLSGHATRSGGRGVPGASGNESLGFKKQDQPRRCKLGRPVPSHLRRSSLNPGGQFLRRLGRRLTVGFLLVGLSAVALSLALAGAPLPLSLDRLAFEQKPSSLSEPPASSYDDRTLYDVEHCALDLTVVPDSSKVRGKVAIAIKALGSLDVVVLDAADPPLMHVQNAISKSGQASVEIWGLQQIGVRLARALAAGERDTVTVWYSATPQKVDETEFFSVHGAGNDPAVASISEPTNAHMWWPCKDVLGDKATGEMAITAPSDLVAASNGLRLSVTDNGNGTTTTRWRTSYPMTTYNVSFALSNYVEWNDP